MRETNTRARLQRMLDEDKEEINGETRAAAKKEFERIAAEFFEPEGETDFTVKRGKSGFEVTVSFRASRVKNFTSLK